ncbi:hypothetical protein [Secundilactobacillus folii]|uniref:Uncharacterized protein n=1 Tax=Secundilactobacillus folii TaxID=2678357 RepID=A0A7X3C3A4_9LACO|nr:hypothetical protein [Secundilactobacillus folii]MTV82064.1 hypothetical protein [Secundilactobacillus folii]
MTDSDIQHTKDDADKKQPPLNLNDLAANPMRVGMERLARRKPALKSKKRHWWSKRAK